MIQKISLWSGKMTDTINEVDTLFQGQAYILGNRQKPSLSLKGRNREYSTLQMEGITLFLGDKWYGKEKNKEVLAKCQK